MRWRTGDGVAHVELLVAAILSQNFSCNHFSCGHEEVFGYHYLGTITWSLSLCLSRQSLPWTGNPCIDYLSCPAGSQNQWRLRRRWLVSRCIKRRLHGAQMHVLRMGVCATKEGCQRGGAEIPLTAVATPAGHFQELAGTARVMVDMSIFQTAA